MLINNKWIKKDKICPFYLYLSAIKILKNKVKHNETLIWVERLNLLTSYMLKDRFEPSKRKIKIQRAKIDSIPTDLLRYIGIKAKTKVEAIIPLDMIKFFKALENTFIDGKINILIEDLTLGKFKSDSLFLIHSLTKLLLSVKQLKDEELKWTLSYIFSSIVIYRQFNVKSIPNVSSLIDPYNGIPYDQLDNLFNVNQIEDWLRSKFSFEELNRDISLKIYSGNASSPNSGSSSSKLLEDAWAVKNDTKLSNSLFSFAKNFKNHDQLEHFLLVLFENVRDLPKALHSRLFHFTAPGGKARIIANVDWITQTVLSGLHYHLFFLLSKIKQDFTFDHKSAIDHIYKGPNEYYSVDLSAATDRMPKYIQAKVIEALLNVRNLDGKRASEDWLNIVDREYDTTASSLNNGQPIRYSVGQGMGLFTSWSIMAFTHHYIVNKLANIQDYVLIGDDLCVIGDASNYFKIMKAIGVPINLTKTIHSNSDKPNIEMARNFIIHGIKIKPLEFGILYAWQLDKTSLETFIVNSDWSCNKEMLIDFISSFRGYIDLHSFGCLLFYYYKYSLTIDLPAMIKKFDLPSWFSNISMEKIAEITKVTKDKSIEMDFIHNNSLTSTLKSQLVVRTELDVAAVADLAGRIQLLSFVDDNIAKIANSFFNRLNSVELIHYTTDYLGNPLLTKRERTLIKWVIKHEIKKNNLAAKTKSLLRPS
uniref:RNA-dependent RNA polymerase n=1 Tax=Grapevine-associated mitovirus 14 TaxID=2814306 RepID=A0A8F5MKZ0_9VIRU|nr:MAG: RNA-dependent RNA polymerase [Grapevine-associated mitovirus 14]